MNLRRQPVQREAVELQLDGALMADAKALGLDAAGVMEDALRESVAAEKARRWREENAEAIRRSNERVERDGLWCDEYRRF
ncbi:type II toxin-antitoxin system CcdA family antitoxin [Enterovirga rhinocerotis]|uniref:Antitoxin CcdA n=1 Tax=Enterovirga rhinocerotis TaxID=1339210 RepID=A0A4R7BR02_9HYPH|nr:type II toxin-antitoxin system CcdA family antitoxin [Enterovirga rhinocerotis]TDR88104.1 antitoxin CcdA [Enterovirga rhinocerotis]